MTTKNELRDAAIAAMMRAYAPYSDFFVGAALLTKSGRIYTGCNIENSSYSATCCAERTALFAAVAAGEREFEAIAIAGGHHGKLEGVCNPCGVCRQALTEFCEPAFPVLLVTAEGYEEHTLGELFPGFFTNLNGKTGQ